MNQQRNHLAESLVFEQAKATFRLLRDRDISLPTFQIIMDTVLIPAFATAMEGLYDKEKIMAGMRSDLAVNARHYRQGEKQLFSLAGARSMLHQFDPLTIERLEEEGWSPPADLDSSLMIDYRGFQIADLPEKVIYKNNIEHFRAESIEQAKELINIGLDGLNSPFKDTSGREDSPLIETYRGYAIRKGPDTDLGWIDLYFGSDNVRAIHGGVEEAKAWIDQKLQAVEQMEAMDI